MERNCIFIFYKNNNGSGYEVIKVKLPKEKCEKFCVDKGFKDYKIMELPSLNAHELHLLSDIVYLDNKYYFPGDIIPYPEKEPDGIGKFQSSYIWDSEYANDEADFEETYNKQSYNRGFGCLWTEVTAKIILPDKTVELAPIAQEIVKYLSEFLNKLEKENHAVYINEEYSEFKWLAWIKEDKASVLDFGNSQAEDSVPFLQSQKLHSACLLEQTGSQRPLDCSALAKIRLIHQNYQEIEIINEFDILVDRDWFFHFGFNMIETMKNYSKADLKRYQEYVINKYGKLTKDSIPYPDTKPLDIGKFEINK